MAIPPIALGDLRESTKDYLLSEANRGKLPTQVIRELLDRKAAREGYKPVAAPTFYLNSSPAPDGEKGED